MQWRDLELDGWGAMPDIMWWPAGGDADCLFFRSNEDRGASSLYALRRGEEPRRLRPIAQELVAFASARVGAVAKGRAIELTSDGGDTWHRAAVLEKDAVEVARLLWASESRLVVGASNGGIVCLEREGDGFSTVWRARPAAGRVSDLVLDDGYVWARIRGDVFRLRLATGQVDRQVEVDRELSSMAVCHRRLLFWSIHAKQQDKPDPSKAWEICVWDEDDSAQSYREVHRLYSPPIAAVMEIESPRCLAVTQMGEGMVLDLATGTLEPQELQVVQAPKVEEQDPNYASKEEVRAAFKLYMQLPKEEREVIAREMGLKADWTPKQKTEWMAEQARLALDRKEAAEGKGAGEETGDEEKGE